MSKPAIPKGTRDFGPNEVKRRNYIVNTIRKVYEQHAYQPIETPAFELLETLTGKYGEEGDQLLFKVLRNGNFLEKASADAMDNYKKLAFQICEKGLRYDLTVPFARFVVMHQNDLSFPFKRYQIQPVWRGDRPQRGRYQEFWQCDADVVGSDSLMYEAEIVQMLDKVFSELGFKVAIKINNRKVLAGIAEAAGISDKFMSMTIAIDKLDKIGEDGVKAEMLRNDISPDAADTVIQLIQAKTLDDLRAMFANSPTGQKGIEELDMVYKLLSRVKINNQLDLDVTLARGLNYYTGAIFEVKALDVQMGSISGGGRYDDLTGLFGLPNVSGVGISFGLDRIYDVMNELNLFPVTVNDNTKVLLVSFDDETFLHAFDQLQILRDHGIAAELYPKPVKMQKQMKYANDRQIPFVAIIGGDEMKNNSIALKNLDSGEQQTLSLLECIAKLRP